MEGLEVSWNGIHARFIDWNIGTCNRMNCRDMPLKMEWWNIPWNGM